MVSPSLFLLISHLSISSVVSSLVHPTQLGRASLASSLPPEAALFVFTDLRVASRSLALDTELHMLYLVRERERVRGEGERGKGRNDHSGNTRQLWSIQ